MPELVSLEEPSARRQGSVGRPHASVRRSGIGSTLFRTVTGPPPAVIALPGLDGLDLALAAPAPGAPPMLQVRSPVALLPPDVVIWTTRPERAE